MGTGAARDSTGFTELRENPDPSVVTPARDDDFLNYSTPTTIELLNI